MESTDQNQELIRSLLDRSSDLKLSKDVVFVIGTDEQKKLTAKELINQIKNKNFTQRFIDKSDAPRILNVPNVDSVNVFSNLIKYVYPGQKIQLDLIRLCSNYLAAHHYSINGLCKMLLEFADSKLSIDYSTILYDQYLKLGNLIDKSKLNEVFDIINLHGLLATQSDKFLKISQDTLIKILESDRLFIQEKDLYYGCLKWIKAELKRKNLKVNFANKLNLFNSIKHLIRFPIMSEHQFFTAVRKVRFFSIEDKMIFEKCPSKSKFFNNQELEEFKKYFKTKDASILSTNYNTNERARMNIGLLIPTGKASVGEHFSISLNGSNDNLWVKMTTSFDGIYRKNEPRDEIYTGLLNYLDSNCYLDAECYIEDCGDNYKSWLTVDYKEMKSPKITDEVRNNNLICDEDSIRVFGIEVTHSSSYWDYGDHLQIVEDGKLIPTHYKRYSIDHTYGYYNYWPTFKLRKGCTYDFKFVCPGEKIDCSTFKLENVFTRKENGDLKLDVQLRPIEGKMTFSCPTRIYFLYK